MSRQATISDHATAVPITTGYNSAPDAELERSLTTEWDAQVIDYPNEEFPFNEWMLNRVRGMGYKLDDLSYLHEAVPQEEVYRVTKQLCADTNLPEFRRTLNQFVREIVVPKGRLRTPVAAISVREILSRKINPDFRGKAF